MLLLRGTYLLRISCTKEGFLLTVVGLFGTVSSAADRQVPVSNSIIPSRIEFHICGRLQAKRARDKSFDRMSMKIEIENESCMMCYKWYRRSLFVSFSERRVDSLVNWMLFHPGWHIYNNNNSLSLFEHGARCRSRMDYCKAVSEGSFSTI